MVVAWHKKNSKKKNDTQRKKELIFFGGHTQKKNRSSERRKNKNDEFAISSIKIMLSTWVKSQVSFCTCVFDSTHTHTLLSDIRRNKHKNKVDEWMKMSFEKVHKRKQHCSFLCFLSSFSYFFKKKIGKKILFHSMCTIWISNDKHKIMPSNCFSYYEKKKEMIGCHRIRMKPPFFNHSQENDPQYVVFSWTFYVKVLSDFTQSMTGVP